MQGGGDGKNRRQEEQGAKGLPKDPDWLLQFKWLEIICISIQTWEDQYLFFINTLQTIISFC